LSLQTLRRLDARWQSLVDSAVFSALHPAQFFGTMVGREKSRALRAEKRNG
jgi:hypothetical protein